MTEEVTTSNLDYTIARITNPTDKPRKDTLRAGFLGHDKVGFFGPSTPVCTDRLAFCS
jgi:hypothetical protein